MKSKKGMKSKSLAVLIAEAVQALDKLEKEVVGDEPTLTAVEKKRRTRARKGGEKVIETIALLTKQFEVTGALIQPDVMLERLAHAKALMPLQQRLIQLAKRVNDAVFRAESDAWSQASGGYTSLRHLARKRGDVATSLAPVEAFFAAHKGNAGAKRTASKAARNAKAATDKPGTADGAPASTATSNGAAHA